MSKLPVEMKIQLSEEMSEKLAKRAYDRNVSVGAVIREALDQFFGGKRAEPAHAAPRKEREPRKEQEPREERELDDTKSRFADAVEHSSNWEELVERLREKGLDIAPKGGGLVVRQSDAGTELCKASEIGFPYSRLIKRYRAGWTAHPHAWLAERILSAG